MREILTSGSAGGLVEQSPILPGCSTSVGAFEASDDRRVRAEKSAADCRSEMGASGNSICSMSKRDVSTRQLWYPSGVPKHLPIHVLSQHPVIAAKVRRADDFRNSVRSLLACTHVADDFCAYEGTYRTSVLANRMTLREGINAIGVQRLGTTVYAVCEALCQSNPGLPGGEPVLNLFAAWPKNWNAQFTLAARGGFLVTASWDDGEPEFVEILSQGGQPCRIRNPWPATTPITIYRNGKARKTVETALLTFATEPHGRYLLAPSGATPDKLRRVVPAK